MLESKVIPKNLYVHFEGIFPFRVRPKIEYIGKKAKELPVLARKDGFEQLYSSCIVPVCMQLIEGEKADL